MWPRKASFDSVFQIVGPAPLEPVRLLTSQVFKSKGSLELEVRLGILIACSPCGEAWLLRCAVAYISNRDSRFT